MVRPTRRINRLNLGVRLALFATSYSPLFCLMIVRQFATNQEFLFWGGFHKEAIFCFLDKFGLSFVLGIVILFGVGGLILSLRNIAISTKINGDEIEVVEVVNRNSEAISYIGTYIIPFLFQDYSSIPDLISIFILLIVIYFIYINSSLILINPVLNLWYALYEISFLDDMNNNQQTPKKGMLIIRDKLLEENDHLKVKKVGSKLFFGLPLRKD